MSRIVIYPYQMYSESSKKLSAALGAVRVYPNRRYRPRAGDIVINWGNSETPAWMERATDLTTFLNRPECVARAVNKVTCFQTLKEAGVATLEFTTDPTIANEWTGTVYARHKVASHSGKGIEIFNEYSSDIPVAPLYTKAKNNHGEYRVHVFNGEVIDYRKKSRRVEDGERVEPTEEQNLVRNLANGWIFRRENLTRLERIEELAKSAVDALGLEFGAVDIIKDENGDVFVLEVNTAVAMEEQTLESYKNAINNLIQNATN